MTEGDAPSFRYSDDEWAAIVATIPPAGIDLNSVREMVEEAATGYFVMTRAHRERLADQSKAREQLAARRDLERALRYAEKSKNTRLHDSVQQALQVLIETTDVEAFTMLSQGHRGRNDPSLALLYGRLLHVWTDTFGSRLTVGRSGGPKNSPVIRFLVAVLAPVHKIGPEAAAKIVEAERKRRKARAAR